MRPKTGVGLADDKAPNNPSWSSDSQGTWVLQIPKLPEEETGCQPSAEGRFPREIGWDSILNKTLEF